MIFKDIQALHIMAVFRINLEENFIMIILHLPPMITTVVENTATSLMGEVIRSDRPVVLTILYTKTALDLCSQLIKAMVRPTIKVLEPTAMTILGRLQGAKDISEE